MVCFGAYAACPTKDGKQGKYEDGEEHETENVRVGGEAGGEENGGEDAGVYA